MPPRTVVIMRESLWDAGKVASVVSDILEQQLVSTQPAAGVKSAVLGALLRLWSMGEPNGELPGHTPESMDADVGVLGFAHALMRIGWLRKETYGLSIPEWEQHNGPVARRRMRDAARKREYRAHLKEARCRGPDVPQNVPPQRGTKCGTNPQDTASKKQSTHSALKQNPEALPPKARTLTPGGAGGRIACSKKMADAESACVACDTIQPTRPLVDGIPVDRLKTFLRAVDLVGETDVSPFRRGQVIDALRGYAQRHDPCSLVAKVIERCKRRGAKNPGAYITQAILYEVEAHGGTPTAAGSGRGTEASR